MSSPATTHHRCGSGAHKATAAAAAAAVEPANEITIAWRIIKGNPPTVARGCGNDEPISPKGDNPSLSGRGAPLCKFESSHPSNQNGIEESSMAEPNNRLENHLHAHTTNPTEDFGAARPRVPDWPRICSAPHT